MAGLHRAGLLLLAHGKDAVWTHCKAVAAEALCLAGRFGLDEALCETAALCHDLGGIYAPSWMLEEARRRGMALDPAEEHYPFLLHQRFSAIICREMLGIGQMEVCAAVACHTTLRAQAGPCDMAVYLADKLAWDQPGEPPYLRVVRDALDISLAHACLTHINYSLDNGMILMPHTWLLQARAWLQKGLSS